MPRSQRDVSLGVTDERFPEGLHLCHIFNDDEERGRTIARYFQQGLKEGERALCLMDSISPVEVRAHLAELGIDVSALDRQFSIADSQQMYCPTGTFFPDQLLDNFGAFCRQAHDEGFSGTRISGDMGWALRTGTRVEELLVYEAKVKTYLETCPATAVCEYDARKFDGSVILDVLSVHPAMIVRGQIVKNPYYVEPADYLARYRARHTPSA
ncbi:MAG TPA: MEDS domain-containing protein [Vicinamibacterales bacterium]|jgi:hypothetical protein